MRSARKARVPSVGIVSPMMAIVAAISFGGIGPSQAQEMDSEDIDARKKVIELESLTITANKRDQKINEVDGSVLVRDGKDLEKAHVTTVADLERVFPGLMIQSRGSRSYANFSLRGVNSPDFYNPSIQVYVDGVPQDSTFFTQELVNVERVELLRGPQGTLYGGNAYAGVINIVSRKPDNAVKGMVGGMVSTAGGETETSLAGPVVRDALYGGLSAKWSQAFGRIDDTLTGKDDIDSSKGGMVRGQLRYAPTGSPWDITAAGQYDHLVSNEEIPVEDPHKLVYSSALYGIPEYTRKVTTGSVNASYEFDRGTLSSLTSYQDRSLERFAYAMEQPEFQTTLSQEVRYAFGDKDGPLDGVVGAFFKDTDFTRKTAQYYTYQGPSENAVASRSYALFGEMTQALTPVLDVTGGLRYSYDTSEIDFTRQGASFYPALDFENSADFHNVSMKLALGWQINEDNRVYGLISRGYKPGGFNHAVMSAADRQAFDNETSTNYELGWHGTVVEDRLWVNASAYLIEAENKQIYVTADSMTGLQALRNLGDSRSYGLEVDVTARPLDSVQVTLGGTFGRSVFVSSTDPVTGEDYDGKTLPYAPDYTLNAAIEYTLPLSSFPGEISLRGAGRYVSASYFDPSNSLKQDGYPVLDLSVNLATDTGIKVAVFADNIADQGYRTYSYSAGATTYSTAGQGRTVGMRASWAF
ncbi:TonB-dependent receptor [Rhodospirillum rubrum]|nr:TonB-dependent receptor [Rhodospirillum rubrum]